ncbi:MAG: NAD(P)-dependent oxidoreductase [Verrucomicrobiota bacterium]
MKVFITGGSGFIGSNLVASCCERKWEVINYDIAACLNSEQEQFRIEGDLMNPEGLRETMRESAPDFVVHLAGRTDCDESTTVEDGYQANTQGTQHVLSAIRETPSVKRAIITSSQFVCGPGRLPRDDSDYFPETVYGWSKVETERMTRAADLGCVWTLTRPTNVWGPWHPRYAKEFWRVVARGQYLHPGVRSPVRTYGYVGNVVWQMMAILEQDPKKVHGKVFNLGDPPAPISEWICAFHLGLKGTKPRVLPKWLMVPVALAGDVISAVQRRPFYITSSRLRSMTTDYPTPVDAIQNLLGSAPYSLKHGVDETVLWLAEHGGPDFEYLRP